MAEYENKRDQSEFNMAVSYLNRINNWFYVSGNAAVTLDAYTWYHTLMLLYRELSTEMDDQEIEQMELDGDKMHRLLDIYLHQVSQGRQGMNSDLYNSLHKFEMRLRKVMKESGLQTKMMDEAAKALR